MKRNILVVEDNLKLADPFKQALTDRFDICLAHTIKDAMAILF